MASFSSPVAMLKWVQNYEMSIADVVSTFPIPYRAAMYYAAILGLSDMVEGLIDEGNDMDVIWYYGTPLTAACIYGNREIVALLLERGADPNLAGSMAVGCPLAAAIMGNHLDLVEMLLARKDVDINFTRAFTKSINSVQKQEVTEVNAGDGVFHWLASLLGSVGSKQGKVEVGQIEDDKGDSTVDHLGNSIGKESTGHRLLNGNGVGEKSRIVSVDDNFDLEILETMSVGSIAKGVISAELHSSTEILETLLDAGVDPNISVQPTFTALERATLDGNESVVRLLISRGASIQRSPNALEIACFNGALEIAELLIAAGSDINHKGQLDSSFLKLNRLIIRLGRYTPLYAAALSRKRNLVKFLIRKGARVNLYGIASNDNPLQIACCFGDIGIARTLLKAGSDVNRQGGAPGTSLYAACDWEDEDLVALLLSRGADPNAQNCGSCDNALQEVCRRGNEILAHLLLEHGADPNLHGGCYGSSFKAACLSGNEFIVRLLLSKNADIGFKGGSYDNALEAAIQSKNEAIVELLLESGLSANDKGGSYEYSILQAADLYYEDESETAIVALLLRHGADPNLHRDGDDTHALKYPTALHYANSKSVASLLLDYGAEIDANPSGYGTPLLIDETGNGPERYDRLSQLLIQRGADINASHWNNISPFGLACISGKVQFAKLMLDKGANVEAMDMIGRTPIFGAISAPESDVFDFLISIGATAIHEDKRGCNGLHYAARIRNAGLLEKLLDLEVDVNKVDCHGRSPLHWATASTMKSTKAIKILLKAGANKNIKDKSGKTPLDHASVFGNTAVVNALVASVFVTLPNVTEDHPASSDTPLQENDAAQRDASGSSENKHERPRDQLLRYCDGCRIV